MRPYFPLLIKFVGTPILLISLPWVGLLVSDQVHDPYLEFPQFTLHIEQTPFSWPIFFLFVAIDCFLLGFFIWALLPRTSSSSTLQQNTQAFPWWGWLAGIAVLLFWILAWTRFSWFAEWQTLTFFPLWVSFIFVINAHTYSRTGTCLLLQRPRFFLLLFVTSALFWWYFEYLNRFIENWKYLGTESFTSLGYIGHCTLAFSTVLPAVFSIINWLQSFPSLGARKPSPPTRTLSPLPLWMMLCGGSFLLMGIVIWPNYLFPFVWVAPLLILLAIQHLLGESTVFSHLSAQGWRPILLPALAGLICGFFWEMWNFYSAAQWVYSIPFVDVFYLFEMPIVGYGGYIPFGLECVVAVGFFSLARTRDKRRKNSGK